MKDAMEALRDELTKSNQARARLGSIVTFMAVVILVLWLTVIYLIVRLEHTNGVILENNEIGKEQLQQICFSYQERTGKISPVCSESEFVMPDGKARK